MFYSKEILTRKNGGFGIIWYVLNKLLHLPNNVSNTMICFNNYRLAATLGSRSSLRKLSKKEVNSVNLIRAW